MPIFWKFHGADAHDERFWKFGTLLAGTLVVLSSFIVLQAEKALVKLNERMMPPPPTPSQNAPQPTPGRLATPAAAPGNPFLAAPRWEDGTSVPADW